MSTQSFNDFVVARGHELTKFANLLARNRAEAEDLLQDTLAAAYASWRRIERAGAPDAYVRRMMVNRHISIWRRHRNRIEPRQQLPEPSVPDATAAADVADAVLRIVRDLPPRQRAAIVLRYYADYPDSEIAEALGCSEATVRSQISRALTSLRALADRAEVGREDLSLIEHRERTMQ
jgi:RNA polymerase sigma-70 factor (sigma-E family)